MRLRGRYVERDESGPTWTGFSIAYEPPVVWMRPVWRLYALVRPSCRVYWGSHGCQLRRPHLRPHECYCCDCVSHLLWRGRGGMSDGYLSDEEWHRMILAFFAAGVQPVSEVFTGEPLSRIDLSATTPLRSGETLTITTEIEL